MTDRVAFYCACPEHQVPVRQVALTMHADDWAYCPLGSYADHDWRQTGAMDFRELLEFLRRHPVLRQRSTSASTRAE